MSIGYEDIPISFGKYKGVLIADIPNAYLNWLLDQEFVETKYPKIYQMAKLEQQYRISNNINIEE